MLSNKVVLLALTLCCSMHGLFRNTSHDVIKELEQAIVYMREVKSLTRKELKQIANLQVQLLVEAEKKAKIA